MASVFVLLEAFNRKEAAALGFFPCATASCCLEQYSILVSRSLFWVKEKDNRFWLSCENVYYVVLCMIDKIKFEDHSSTKYLYAAASSSPHSLSKLPFSS